MECEAAKAAFIGGPSFQAMLQARYIRIFAFLGDTRLLLGIKKGRLLADIVKIEEKKINDKAI